jgi:hypothetical protein
MVVKTRKGLLEMFRLFQSLANPGNGRIRASNGRCSYEQVSQVETHITFEKGEDNILKGSDDL